MPGLYFEEFTLGQKFVHPIRRTVTEADNVFFTALTHNPAALHLDAREKLGSVRSFAFSPNALSYRLSELLSSFAGPVRFTSF